MKRNVFKQITKADWNEVHVPLAIVTISLLPEEMERMYGIKFEKAIDDSGTLLFSVIEISEAPYCLQTNLGVPKEGQYVTACVRSFERDLNTVLKKLLNAFELDASNIKWIQPDLSEPSWSLFRLDDNGNEIEMYRFREKRIAEEVMEIFENRGHKQAYFVKIAN